MSFLKEVMIYKIFFLFQDRGLNFGLQVLPCSSPPGVKIFGSAPQFNAKNFSHVFVHGSDYEIPGKQNCFQKCLKYSCYPIKRAAHLFVLRGLFFEDTLTQYVY